MGIPNYCPEDCMEEPTSGGSSGEPLCPVYFGNVPNLTSVWQEGATVGTEAGEMKCRAMGADHLCDYEDMVAASEQGELDILQLGFTAWVHRTTAAEVQIGMDAGDTVVSAPELGGRCVNWTYGENALADGEYMEITAEGVVFPPRPRYVLRRRRHDPRDARAARVRRREPGDLVLQPSLRIA